MCRPLRSSSPREPQSHWDLFRTAGHLYSRTPPACRLLYKKDSDLFAITSYFVFVHDKTFRVSPRVSRVRHCFDARHDLLLTRPAGALAAGASLHPHPRHAMPDQRRPARFPSPQVSAAVVHVPRAGRAMPQVVNSLRSWFVAWAPNVAGQPLSLTVGQPGTATPCVQMVEWIQSALENASFCCQHQRERGLTAQRSSR